MNTSLKPSSFKVADRFLFIVFWDSAPKPDAGSTEDMQQSQDRFERLLEVWLTFWQARQTHVVWAQMCFLPLCWQTVNQGQVPRSQQPDINSHKRKMVNFLGKHYFNFCAWKHWVWQTDGNSLPLTGRCELEADCPLLLFLAGEGAVTELQTAASRDKFHEGWCQGLAKGRHFSYKTMSLIQKSCLQISPYQLPETVRPHDCEMCLVLHMRKVMVLQHPSAPPRVGWGRVGREGGGPYLQPREKDQVT